MILLLIIFSQLVAAVIIVCVLREILKRELVVSALQELGQLEACCHVAEVSVIMSTELSPADNGRLKSVLSGKFPCAAVNYALDRQIQGGIVIQADGLLIDHSLLTRLKHLWGGEGK